MNLPTQPTIAVVSVVLAVCLAACATSPPAPSAVSSLEPTVLTVPAPAPLPIDEIRSLSGWACDIDSDPTGNSRLAAQVSVRYMIGGDADPTDDSRSIWMRAREDDVLFQDAIGTQSPLENGVIHLLHIPGFTTGGDGTFVVNLWDSGTGVIEDLVLTKEVDTDDAWMIEDFLVAASPRPDGEATDGTIVYDDNELLDLFLLDTDASSGTNYCWTAVIGKLGSSGSEVEADLRIKVDPIGTTPDVPQVDFEYAFLTNPSSSDELVVQSTARESGLSVSGVDFPSSSPDVFLFVMGLGTNSGVTTALQNTTGPFDTKSAFPVGSAPDGSEQGFPTMAGVSAFIQASAGTGEAVDLHSVNGDSSSIFEVVKE